MRSKSVEKKTNKSSTNYYAINSKISKENTLISKISNKKSFGGTIDIDAKRIITTGIRTGGF